MKIRSTQHGDIAALMQIADDTGLFPGDMLPDMVAPFLAEQDSQGLWLTCLQDDAPVGFCYAAPEALTEGTWNMLALAVQPAHQGQGMGRAITQRLEADLAAQGHRILIVDTSGSDDFALTRAFYEQNGYTQEARIRDYWAEGDDKVIYRKALTGA